MDSNYDVVVIGAGIHGAGVAQAAAARGYRVLVLEKNTVASGTSCKSSKLIHGGLRYLETAQFSLVRECLQERAILLRNAADLVRLKPFIIPIYKWSSRRPWKIALGLELYSLLSGLKPHLRYQRINKNQWHDLDGLSTHDLQAVFQYYDAQTDDQSLTLSVLQSAQEFDAVVECHAKVISVQIEQKTCEIKYQDKSGNMNLCTATCVVNAAGPWINEVIRTVSPKLNMPAIDLVQGCHVVLNQKLNRGIYYIESRSDRRAVFVMPWYGKTLLGTTENLFRDKPDNVKPLESEIDYLMGCYQNYFPSQSAQQAKFESAFAGLRVLPRSDKSAFSRPRETYLHSDVSPRPRFVSIVGGKLTAYRATAEKVLNQLAFSLPLPSREGDTRKIALHLPSEEK